MNPSDIAARLAEPYGDFSATLAAWATAHPDAIALRDETGALTWAEMADRIERASQRAAALRHFAFPKSPLRGGRAVAPSPAAAALARASFLS